MRINAEARRRKGFAEGRGFVRIRICGIMGFSGFRRRAAFCQNQDLWDYRIFRILTA